MEDGQHNSIKDFAKEVSDQIGGRLKSNFLFSFCLGWVFVNWRIIVTLFWYDPSQFYNTNNIFFFLNKFINVCDNFFLPFIVAIVFSICYPVIQILFNLYNNWINNIGEKRKSIINRDALVSKRLFDELNQKHNSLVVSSDIALQEEKLQSAKRATKIEELNTEIAKAKLNAESQKQRIALLDTTSQELKKQIASIHDASIITGLWLVDYSGKREKWRMDPHTLYREGQINGSLKNFMYSKSNNELYFEFYYHGTKSSEFFLLEFFGSDIISGKKDGSIDITFTRQRSV